MAVEIQKFTNTTKLSEICQEVETQFSFVTGPKSGRKQCHQFAKCRDFLHDAVWAYINKSVCNIHRFNYKYGEYPNIDLKKMRMLVFLQKEDKNFKAKIKRAQKILHHYENMAGWPKSRISTVVDENQMILFTGSARWMLSPPLVSMYTLLIRLGDKNIEEFKTDKELQKIYEKLGNTKYCGNDNDLRYIRDCYDKLDIVIKYHEELFGKKIEENYPSGIDKHSFHDYGGILSLCTFSLFKKEITTKFMDILRKEGRLEAKTNG